MTAYGSSVNKLTNFLAAVRAATTESAQSAFSNVTGRRAQAAEEARDEPKGETWNGDVNYASIGTDFTSQLLELGQKLVGNEIKDASGYKTNTGKYLGHKKPHGSKRTGTASPPDDPTQNIPQVQQESIKAQCKKLFALIRTEKCEKRRAVMVDIFFRFIFRERAIASGKRSAEGKGNRSLSYFLFHLIFEEMPESSRQLVSLFVHYGYYNDIDGLIAYFKTVDEPMTNQLIQVYVDALDSDAHQLLGTGLIGTTHSVLKEKVEALRTQLDGMKPDTIKELYQHHNLSLAGKWLSSEGKHNSEHRPILLARLFCANLDDYSQRGPGFHTFIQRLFRIFTTCLRKITGVVEAKMSANRWGDIDEKSIPAGCLHKNRMAFLNEKIGESCSLELSATGNRTTDPDRISLREQVLKSAIDGKLKGAGMDCCKVAAVIWPRIKKGETISASERQVLHAQFLNVVDDIKQRVLTEHESAMAKWEETGAIETQRPLHPLDVIATIDVSGSMESANVMGPAIVLGIITTCISQLCRSFITFHENPTLIKLQEDGDIVDWMTQVSKAPWGGSTNMDGAMKLLLQVCKDVRSINPSFEGKINHIIFTDGQFNSQFCRTDATVDYHYRDLSNEDNTGWNTFADRMKQTFSGMGFYLPRTTFWNMNCSSPGFPAHGKYKGLVLTEGLNQGLFLSALGSGTTFTQDKDGAMVAAVDPVDTFMKSIARPDFDLVSERLATAGESVFGKSENCEFVRRFYDQYQ